jgi:tetratricopeptide (TPR) repeat protein
VRTALPARMLRWLNGSALLAALAGCQADPAALAQHDTSANRPSVLQLVAAEEPAAPSSNVPRQAAVEIDPSGMELPPTKTQPKPPASSNRSAVLLEPPETQAETKSEDLPAEPDKPLDGIDAYLEVARMAQQRGLAALAEKYYFKAVHAYPEAAVAWNDLGQFYLTQEKYPQGVHATQMAVRLEPESRRYHNNLGVLLVRNGQLDEGIREFAVAVGHAAAHYNAGVVLHELGKRPESVRQMQLALAEDPNLRQAQAALGHLAPGAGPAKRTSAKPSAATKEKRVQRRSEGPALNAAARRSQSNHAAKAAARGDEKSLAQRFREFFHRPSPSTPERTARRSASVEIYKTQEQPRRGFFSFLHRDRDAHTPQTASHYN